MDLQENIREGLRSVRGNLLRSILTAAIVAIGIMSLVGILTAIDSMKASIVNNLSSLGADSFTIESKDNQNQRRSFGRREKQYGELTYFDVREFRERYEPEATISTSTYLTGSAEVKRGSKKTNPNVRVIGTDPNFLELEGYGLQAGRNVTEAEVEYGSNVILIGPELEETLFDDNEEAVGQELTVLGTKFRIVGVLEEAGTMGGSSGTNRMVVMPVSIASRFAGESGLAYELNVQVGAAQDVDDAMGEATGVMRMIRRDRLGEPESFEISRNESAAESLNEISGSLRIGGFVIGIITLLGASIGLMNIMMVSVTERTREIGVRKALGATPKKIRLQFLIEAIIICLLGGISGIVLGILMGNMVSSLVGEGVFLVPWLWLIMGVSICVAVGLMSGYMPARKASRLDPVDSLRYE